MEIKKAPLGMALLKYKDAVDLKKTAERVEEADEIEKQANQIISRKWEIIDNAEKEAKRKTQKIEKELKEKQEKLEIFSKAVDELKEKYSSLLNSEYLIRQWKIEEYQRGLENHEKLFKDTEKIKKQFEEDNDNKQSQNRSQGQGRRRR